MPRSKRGAVEWRCGTSRLRFFHWRKARNNPSVFSRSTNVASPGNSPTTLTAREEAMAANRDRLIFRFFRLVEGEAEGRFAISALVALVLATLVVCFALKGVG
jgi:hypothetical protein